MKFLENSQVIEPVLANGICIDPDLVCLYRLEDLLRFGRVVPKVDGSRELFFFANRVFPFGDVKDTPSKHSIGFAAL